MKRLNELENGDEILFRGKDNSHNVCYVHDKNAGEVIVQIQGTIPNWMQTSLPEFPPLLASRLVAFIGEWNEMLKSAVISEPRHMSVQEWDSIYSKPKRYSMKNGIFFNEGGTWGDGRMYPIAVADVYTGIHSWSDNFMSFATSIICVARLDMSRVFVGKDSGGGYEFVDGNSLPTIELNTANSQTLYESSTLNINGAAKDVDSGDVVTVKYQINGGQVRNLQTAISDGTSSFTFAKTLNFAGGMLKDGTTPVTGTLTENQQHTLTVWAQDGDGAKSAVQTRIFYVVPNRPATLTIDPVDLQSELIDSDILTISGSVSDPDNNVVSVKYKIGGGSFLEVYEGTGGSFIISLPMTKLVTGENIIGIQAVDGYGAVTTKTLKITKSQNAQPLKQAVTRYKLMPPNGSAKGVVVWIQREIGDLSVDAEISMTSAGETEDFQPMTKSATAFVSTGIEEDEFTFEHTAAVENIILKITMTRENTSSTHGITLISGVLS